jgi:uncharacterized protein YndB with AHSA1/START domain
MAPPAMVYRALLDARAVATWKVPTGMTSHLHAFDTREGGCFRVSLTYDGPTGTGKTTAHTDTYHGHFVKLVPNEQVVEMVEFETTDPALRGETTITITLADADDGTDIVAVHDGLPRGVPNRRQRGRLAGGPREARGARRGGLEHATRQAVVEEQLAANLRPDFALEPHGVDIGVVDIPAGAEITVDYRLLEVERSWPGSSR